jgi:copper resistance protein C
MTATHATAPAHAPQRHRSQRRAIVLAAAAILLLVVAVPAHGHAHLLETSPQDGAELDEPPTEVVLTFDEAVEPAGDALVLTDGDEAAHQLEAAVGPETGQISAELPADAAAGGHTIAWRIVAADGHVQEGAFTYSVAAPVEEADDLQEADVEERAEPDAGDVEEEAAAEEPEEPDADELDAEALGVTGEDDGGAGWLIAAAVLVAAAMIAGALVLGGRRRAAAEEGA